MSALITGKLLIELKTDSVKYLSQSLCFKHWYINDLHQNQPSKIANTECLL